MVPSKRNDCLHRAPDRTGQPARAGPSGHCRPDPARPRPPGHRPGPPVPPGPPGFRRWFGASGTTGSRPRERDGRQAHAAIRRCQSAGDRQCSGSRHASIHRNAKAQWTRDRTAGGSDKASDHRGTRRLPTATIEPRERDRPQPAGDESATHPAARRRPRLGEPVRRRRTRPALSPRAPSSRADHRVARGYRGRTTGRDDDRHRWRRAGWMTSPARHPARVVQDHRLIVPFDQNHRNIVAQGRSRRGGIRRVWAGWFRLVGTNGKRPRRGASQHRRSGPPATIGTSARPGATRRSRVRRTWQRRVPSAPRPSR